jgi:hypothetical protein
MQIPRREEYGRVFRETATIRPLKVFDSAVLVGMEVGAWKFSIAINTTVVRLRIYATMVQTGARRNAGIFMVCARDCWCVFLRIRVLRV